MKKVLVFGTFDILHKVHKEFLTDAKNKGDTLIVIVIHDNLVYKNKKKYPLNSQKKRATNLKRLNLADEVIGVSDKIEMNLKLIKKISPDLVVLGYDQTSSFFKTLRKELKHTKFARSKKFAKGIHSSDLR